MGGQHRARSKFEEVRNSLNQLAQIQSNYESLMEDKKRLQKLLKRRNQKLHYFGREQRTQTILNESIDIESVRDTRAYLRRVDVEGVNQGSGTSMS